MINIDRDKVNRVYMTLSEKEVFTGGTMTMRFTSNEDKNVIKDMPLNNDLTLNSNRYNQYDITENINEDLSNQIISLPNSSYDYRIYNSTGSTVDSNSIIIETGLVLIDFKNDSFSSGSTYRNNNNSDDITFV